MTGMMMITDRPAATEATREETALVIRPPVTEGVTLMAGLKIQRLLVSRKTVDSKMENDGW